MEELKAHELDRACEYFARTLETTHDPREAMRVALIDFVSRLLPKERQRVASQPVSRPLFERHQPAIEHLCAELRASVHVVVSFSRATGANVDARGVLVAVLTDAGLSARQISDGIGISNSVVNNVRILRARRPDWEPLVARFGPMFRKRT